MTNNSIIKNNKGLLAKKLSPLMLQSLNDLLHSNLDDISKNNILALVLEAEELYNYNKEKYLIDLIYSFFLNEALNKDEKFKEIISLIRPKKLDFNIIDTYIMLGKVTDNVFPKKVLDWALSLANIPSDWYQNYRLVSALLKDERLLTDIDRLDIIINILTKKEATFDILNGNFTAPFVVEVLASDTFDYSKRIDIDYKKIVEFAINNLGWHFISSLLNKGLGTEKIELAVDYYSKLYDKYIIDWNFVTLDKLDTDFKKIPLYNLPFFISHLKKDTYANILANTKNSSNPLSHIIVEVSNIEDNRKEFALGLIDSSSDEYTAEFGKPENDYLDTLATIATSNLAETLDIDNYKDILSYIKDCLIKNKAIENKEKEAEKEGIYTSKYLDDSSRRIPELLLELFTKAPHMAQNKVRLEYLIELIKKTTEENYYVVREIIKIATSINSMYYSDEEFVKLVNIMHEIHDRGYINHIIKDQDKYFNLKYLFTNNNVPFMNRNALFDIAVNATEDKIVQKTDTLNKQGLLNRNMAALKGTLTGALKDEYVLERKK